MSLSRILKHVRNSWRTLAVCVVAGLVLGGLATLIQSPSYEAKSTVVVSPNGALGQPDAALGAGVFIQQRAQSYIEVAKSPRVLRPAAQEAGVDSLTGAQVRVDWLTSSPANLDITVKQSSARDAAAVANAVAEQLGTVVATLERPSGGGEASVRVSLARAADVPDSPVRPDPMVNLLLGLVGGLAVGFPLVLAGLLFRRGITDAEALSEATGESPIGIIGMARGAGLILRDAPQSMPAEAFRKLRTSVQFAKPDAAPRSIVVTGPRLRVGATTVAANLALAMAEAGRRVVLVDANLRDPAVAGLLRLKAHPGLAEVLAGDVEVAEALQAGDIAGLRVLTAGQGAGAPGSVVAGARMITVLEQLESQAEAVIIDAPPVLPYADAAELAAIADAAVIVARYRKTGVEDFQQARSTLSQVGTTVLGVVINGVPGSGSAAGAGGAKPPARSNSAAAKPDLADHPSP